MMLIGPFKNMLMSSIAEWCVSTHFTITKLVVSTFADVETYRSQSSGDPFTLTVAHWMLVTGSTTTPIVDSTSMKIHMSWIDTSKSWQTWWSISSLFIWSALA